MPKLNSITKTRPVFTTYDKAVHWCGNHYILCNNIVDIDQSIWDNFDKEIYNEEEGRYTEIYQWYITDCSEMDVEWLSKKFDVMFTYSEKLDCYILAVDHCGTSWDYVACEVLEDDVKARVIKDNLTYKDLTGYDR